jgi:hypothetical protein
MPKSQAVRRSEILCLLNETTTKHESNEKELLGNRGKIKTVEQGKRRKSILTVHIFLSFPFNLHLVKINPLKWTPEPNFERKSENSSGTQANGEARHKKSRKSMSGVLPPFQETFAKGADLLKRLH